MFITQGYAYCGRTGSKEAGRWARTPMGSSPGNSACLRGRGSIWRRRQAELPGLEPIGVRAHLPASLDPVLPQYAYPYLMNIHNVVPKSKERVMSKIFCK